jgi:hypothetical protein
MNPVLTYLIPVSLYSKPLKTGGQDLTRIDAFGIQTVHHCRELSIGGIMNQIVRLKARKLFHTALVTGIALNAPFFAHAQSLPPQHPSSPPTQALSTLTPDMKKVIAHSSLAFEANKGQTDKRVQFLARGAGYSLYLTPTRAVFDFQEAGYHKSLTPETASAHKPIHHQALAMQLVGASSHPDLTGRGELPGKVNYFFGNDPKHWHSKIATFNQVRYSSVYPGVDLVYYGNQQSLEYDFVVAPHRDPNQIAFKMQGAKSLNIDGHGDLVVGLSQGKLRWHKPVVYQEVQGQRKSVAGHYRLQGDRIAFAVAQYDTSRPLVIDPQLVYSTYLGGSSADYGNAIATYVDPSSGNTYVYVTGETTSTNFPTTVGAYDRTYNAGTYAFVTKLDLTQSGNASVVFSTFLGDHGNVYGTNGFNQGNALAFDSSGNVYIGGNSTPPSSPTFGFAAKLSSDGSTLSYFISPMGPGTYLHTVTGIAVEAADKFWVVGSVVGSATYFFYPYPMYGYQPSPGTSTSLTNAYVMRFTLTGTPPAPAHDYATLLQSTGGCTGTGIALDSHSPARAYVTGYCGGSIDGFASVTNSLQSTYQGNGDAFLTVLDSTQSGTGTMLYASYIGSSDYDAAYGITTVPQGSDIYTYVVGTTSAHSGFPTYHAYATGFGGTTGGAAFLSVFKNLTGTPLMTYSTLIGGGGSAGGDSDLAVGVAADTSGKAYLTGDGGVRFPITKDAWQPYGNVFVSKFDTTLSGSASLLYSTYLGGSADNQAASIAIDGSGNAYITGRTDSYADLTTSPLSLPLPTTATAYQKIFQSTGGVAGPYNAFVTKLSTAAETHTSHFDFDGDGLNDLVFQNTSTNAVVAWYMQAYRYLGGAFTSLTPASGYHVVGVADFDGDGHPDLLFQNTSTGALVIWYMNGTTVTGSASVSATPASGYTVAGVGDFNGDGHPDILFQKTSTGAVVIWYLGGTGGYTYSSGTTLSSTLPTGYTVAGVGDFGGAAHADIVLQNTSTGAVTFWLMTGSSGSTIGSTTSLTGAAATLTSLPSGYTIVAIADYNSDGKTDLVLQNGAGAILFLFLQGTYVVGGGTSDQTPASGYLVVGPH